MARAIEEAVTLGPGMSALEVGGGTGRLSILLCGRVGSVVVTDPSAGVVQVAQERIEAAGLGDRLRAVRADLATDPLEGADEVVWSSLALHHAADLEGLLRSVARLLVDGGRLAIADLERGEPVDASGQVPTVWWQTSTEADPQWALPEQSLPQRWHFDVWVPHDNGEQRLNAVLEAGGRLVSDAAAPSYWVVEAADGNRSCICTPHGR